MKLAWAEGRATVWGTDPSADPVANLFHPGRSEFGSVPSADRCAWLRHEVILLFDLTAVRCNGLAAAYRT